MKRWLVCIVALAVLVSACASGAKTTTAVDAGSADAPTLTGRAALANVQGEPHILWFWGAH